MKFKTVLVDAPGVYNFFLSCGVHVFCNVIPVLWVHTLIIFTFLKLTVTLYRNLIF